MTYRNNSPVPLAHSFRQIADAIGDEAARLLVKSFGGNRWYVASKANPDHRFVKVIGLKGFEALCAAFGGEHIEIPRSPELSMLKIRILNASGSHREVATLLGCTERQVRMVRASVRRDAAMSSERSATPLSERLSNECRPDNGMVPALPNSKRTKP